MCCCLALTTKLKNGKNTNIFFWYLYYCYGVPWESKNKYVYMRCDFYRMQQEATRTVVNGNSINQHFCPIFTENHPYPNRAYLLHSSPKERPSISVAAYSKWKLFANWRFCRNCATSNNTLETVKWWESPLYTHQSKFLCFSRLSILIFAVGVDRILGR